MRHFHLNTKEETQEKFPLKSILGARKPESLLIIEKRSEGRVNRSLSVKKAIEGGAKTFKQVEQITGLTADQITNTRVVLRRREIDVPREALGFNNLKERLEEAKDDRETQAILDNAPSGSMKGYLRNHRGDTFTALGPILRSAGFHINNRYYKRENIDGLVKNAGIPLVLIPLDTKSKTGYYHVVLIRDKQRIIDLLNREPRLQRFKKKFLPLTNL